MYKYPLYTISDEVSLRRKEEKENNSEDVRFMHQIQTQGAISKVSLTHTSNTSSSLNMIFLVLRTDSSVSECSFVCLSAITAPPYISD